MDRDFSLRCRFRRLTACIAVALSQVCTSGSSGAGPVPNQANGQTRLVTNCDDSGPDSLRDIITNPNSPHHALSNDTVDLGQLPVLCTMADSTITLSSGEITIDQVNLTLQGPSPELGSVTISGGGMHRVLKHASNGTLSIYDLRIADGYYHSAAAAYGGCIEALGGSVHLTSSNVVGCTVRSDSGSARGGGIHNPSDVTLVLSKLSGNRALASSARGYGGGVAAGNLFGFYSSISDNIAGDGSTHGGVGGGAYVTGGISMLASTVDHNTASYGGGLKFRSSTIIVNSTISDNTAHKFVGALMDGGSDSLTIANSTIAFNHTDESSPYGAVYFRGQSANSAMTLQSSIIANNTAGATNTPSDLSMIQGALLGGDNLVIASTIVDPTVITVIDDPRLGPLQYNGGVTRTRALKTGSPAIGAGNHDAMPPGFAADQRGRGYPRSTGAGANATTDIGAFEFNTIFVATFDL